MTQQALSDTAVTWTFENYATLVSMFGGGIAICALVTYIYMRSGSLLFLRDLMWRFFGGTTKFESARFEQMRKDLRELEYYRFEFNIPARTLKHAELAEEWIWDNELSPDDVARVKNYIDWSDFSSLRFKTKLFSTWIGGAICAVVIFFMTIIMVSIPLASAKYLMVSLKHEPQVPSFYLSTTNAKFDLWPDYYLTTTECSSSESLQKFIKPDISEKHLRTICSFFLDKEYANFVRSGVAEQRGFIVLILLLSIFVVIISLVSLTRRSIARALHKQLINGGPAA